MRILHVMTRFLRGGAEEKTLLELQHLRGDHEYALATGPGTDPVSLERVRALGVPHLVVPSLLHYRPWRAPAAIREIRRILRRGAYDLVHTHSTEAGILGREAARREKVPRVVHTIHGLEFTDAHPFLVRNAVVALHRRLAPATHRYFSNAHVLTAAYLEAGIGRPEQYACVRSAVDLEALDATAPGTLDGDPIVLTAGRLAPGKGFEEVIDAAADVARERPGLRLYVAGDGPLAEDLRARASKKLPEGSVRFLGHRPDLPSLLKAADVFVFGSHREGTPRVVTEALAVGCPIVSTDVDGIPEQVQDGVTGLLVPPRRPMELAAALRRVLEDPAAARMRAQAGRRAAQEFGIPRMVEALRHEYARLAPP